MADPSSSRTVTCTSMMSFAARPGTEVDPIWSIRTAASPSAARRVSAKQVKRRWPAFVIRHDLDGAVVLHGL